MKIYWNQKQEGFQKCWLWQYGPGPFIVLDRSPVTPKSNFLGRDVSEQDVYVSFESGEWFYIAIPDNRWQPEYPVNGVMFHSKWFVKESVWQKIISLFKSNTKKNT